MQFRPFYLLLLFWSASLVLVINYRYRTPSLKQVAVFQPLTTGLTGAVALLSLFQADAPLSYRVGILIGLGLSLIADTILIDIDNPLNFKIGLGIFFAALLSYTLGIQFTLGGQLHTWMVYLGMAIFCAGVLRYLWPGLGADKLFVTLYILAFWGLVGSALSTLFVPLFPFRRACWLTVGAILFMAADLMLAIYKYRWPIPQIWATFGYFAGQLFIILSLY